VKMGDVRSTNRDLPTMMHYIVSKMETTYPESYNLRADFPHLEAASKENLNQVQTDLAALKGNLAIIEKQVKSAPAEGVAGDKFYTLMKDFLARGTNQFTKVQAKYDNLNNSVKDILSYFGEREEAPLNEFLDTVWKGVYAYEKARQDNIKKKEALVKAKEAEVKKAAAAQAAAARKAAGGGPGPGGRGAGGRGAGGGGQVMDKMLGALATGEAFRKPGATGSVVGRGGPPTKEDKKEVANEAMAMFAKLKERNQSAGGPGPGGRGAG